MNKWMNGLSLQVCILKSSFKDKYNKMPLKEKNMKNILLPHSKKKKEKYGKMKKILRSILV